jgi:hypothetical protein
VGPKGTVANLAKQKEDLKAQLAERDRQLAEKAMQLAGEWLNQEEAIQEAEGVYRFVLDEVERRINTAGPALYVLEFLESELPDDKFRKLTFAISLAQVKRESQNPDSPYFADLPMRKKELLGAFPATEEYQRLRKEKMENLHKRRQDLLQRIREDSNNFATIEMWVKTGGNLLNTFVKPMVEAYLNPKETASDDSRKSRQKRTRQEQLKPTKQVKMKGIYPLLLSHT